MTTNLIVKDGDNAGDDYDEMIMAMVIMSETPTSMDKTMMIMKNFHCYWLWW